MNTKLYKQVFTLAGDLLESADNDDSSKFDRLYVELKSVCEEHEHSDKNHPVQWETLADFTEEGEPALALYKKALGYAGDIDAIDYMASISYAMALLINDNAGLQQANNALILAEQANEYAAQTDDSELKRETHQLLKSLQ